MANIQGQLDMFPLDIELKYILYVGSLRRGIDFLEIKILKSNNKEIHLAPSFVWRIRYREFGIEIPPHESPGTPKSVYYYFELS